MSDGVKQAGFCDTCKHHSRHHVLPAFMVKDDARYPCTLGECICPGFTYTNVVDHPPHYNSHPSGIECITITRHMGFNLGNALKYIWRADLKGSAIEDLEKAVWYLKDEIERRKTETGRNPSK